LQIKEPATITEYPLIFFLFAGKTVVLGIRPENISDEKGDVANTACKVTTEVTGYELMG